MHNECVYTGKTTEKNNKFNFIVSSSYYFYFFYLN